MNRRALLVALALASMGATLLFFYLRRFEQEASGGDRVKLLSTVKPIERNGVITEDSIAVREVPQAYVEDRAIKASDKQKVVGLRVGAALPAQTTLMWSDLSVASEERRDLSALVQPGNRAMAIRATNDDKSVALMHPGDYIDIIATMSPGDKNDISGTRTSIVLLQKVLVLAIGLDTEVRPSADGSKTTSRDLLLTVSVNLQEAQLLSLAVDKGRLSVALRNPEDPRVVEGIPDMSSTALVDAKARTDVQRIRRSGPVQIGPSGARP